MQGNQQILTTLNQLLAGELTASDQYLIHSEIYADLGLQQLADKSLHESDHERLHARQLLQRLLFLEGKPDLSQRPAIVIGTSVTEMLKADLALEYHVVGELKKAIAASEIAEDYVTREILVVQLEDTEMDHAYWLEQQIRLIDLIGLQNYQQSQLKTSV